MLRVWVCGARADIDAPQSPLLLSGAPSLSASHPLPSLPPPTSPPLLLPFSPVSSLSPPMLVLSPPSLLPLEHTHSEAEGPPPLPQAQVILLSVASPPSSPFVFPVLLRQRFPNWST